MTASIDVGDRAAGVVVVGSDADLAAVLTRLLRTDRLDVEVATCADRWHGRAGPAPATAQRVPLIRDETGTVHRPRRVLAAARRAGRTIHGEAVVDDTVLFDGEVTGVRIEPTADACRACARACCRSRMRPRRWVTGRAAQLGTDGRARGARRRASTAAGPAVDVLSAHRGLAGRPVTHGSFVR